jgi:hypothetical protein
VAIVAAIERDLIAECTQYKVLNGICDFRQGDRPNRHCERSEAIHKERSEGWIASSLRSSQ